MNEVSLSQGEIFQALTGVEAAPPPDFEGFLRQWCQQRDVTLAYLTGVLLRELKVEKFKQLAFAGQVESEFLRRKAELDQVEFSLIQTPDFALAEELYFQLRDDGAQFAQLAQRHALGSARQTGGWMGPVSLSTLPVAIATAFRQHPVGRLQAPIAVEQHFWIVRLEQVIEARLTAATRALLIDQLYQSWLQTQVKQAIATPGAIAFLDQPQGRSLTAA